VSRGVIFELVERPWLGDATLVDTQPVEAEFSEVQNFAIAPPKAASTAATTFI
jgi:hypothetical protein